MAEGTGQHSFGMSEEKAKDKLLGMWFLIAAEVVMFGGLFGVYLTLKSHIGDGPPSEALFEIKEVAKSTFVLLSSSFTCALAFHHLKTGQKDKVILLLSITLLLGMIFLGLEIKEFLNYVKKGYRITSSPFLSSFYLLVGTHGSHVLAGCIWMVVLLSHLIKKGLNAYTGSKVHVFSLYWHFVDVVWVFIFTVVYLFGKVG
ncbi:cytochrome c oxidase subunit 3 [Falsibacillus albus]|uniref:Cytochrome (Ubi)quinol oxidase subunit III n=1 Tax=Falsibacillus albus TaxID=2478915 RepID=A0A3L7K0Y3_9BACI|nr:cytochrome c oxidase subunit 3 [Falsibacillus albus]RLQ96728.1 cytochrome (ubi)quinol oxidase subunit III [Falsibacillus albus]